MRFYLLQCRFNKLFFPSQYLVSQNNILHWSQHQMDQPDKMTETRGSLDGGNSFLRRFYSIMCPCISAFNEKKKDDRSNLDYFESDQSNRSSVRQYELPRKNTLDFSPYMLSKNHDPFKEDSIMCSNPVETQFGKRENPHKSRSFVHSISNSPKKQRQTARETVDFRQIEKRMANTQKKEWYNFPVFKYREGQVVILGKNNKNLLAQISSVKLQPSPSAVQKQFSSKQQKNTTDKFCKKFDEFWNSRYFYFERFDQGIQIDKESLCSLTPEAVSDYIAGKCYDCRTVLDAFSGVGHNATKLGTACEKVICVEEEAKKYNFLINNAKCYEIYNLELFMKPFLEISLKQKVDVALLHPQIIHPDYLLSSMCEGKHFKPNLSLTIRKGLQVANNLVLLLPPNINIKEICYEISKSSQQIQEKMPCSCSVKIEKIYFRNSLKYVAVFFGWNVQQEIKINAELGFIYKVLKDPMERGFGKKKLIKYLREKYGIIKLLNFVSESRSIQRPGKNEIQKLVEFIRQRKLILQHKLQSLLVEQRSTQRKAPTGQNSNSDEVSSQQSNSPDFKRIIEPYSLESGKQPIEEQERQYEDEGQTITQRTQSFYSSGSVFSTFKKRVTIAITESGKRTDNEKNTTSDIKIQRESNPSSIVMNKIVLQASSLDKDPKSPPSPTILAQNRVGNYIQNKNNTSQNQKGYRHTMNTSNKKRQTDFLKSARQNLKRTLIEN